MKTGHHGILRILAFTLLVCLTVSLAACETAGKPAGTSASNAAGGETTTLQYMSTLAYQEDPLWYDTELHAAILEQANVAIDYYFLDSDKYALALASNELGDFVYAADTTKINTIVETGLAKDIKPLLANYCPNMLLEYYAGFVGIVSTMTGGGEKLYFLPEHVGVELVNGGVELARGYYLRWDYYKEIGAPIINNDDDYVSAIEKMVAAHPTTADGKKVWGVGIADSWSNWYYHAMFTSVRANGWTFPGYLYMQSVETLGLLNGYLDAENSAFWQSMIFYNKLWNKGLLDPDSFTMKADEYNTRDSAGQYVASLNWKSSKLYSAARASDPNTLAGYIAVPAPNELVFANNPNPSGWFPSYSTFIPEKSTNWEAVLRLYNIVLDPKTQRTLQSGIEGTHWNYVDGVPTPTDLAIGLFSGTTTGNESVGIGGQGPFIIIQPGTELDDGYPACLFEMDNMRKIGLTPIQKDFSEYFKVDYPAKLNYQYVLDGTALDWSKTYGTELLTAAMTAMPTDINRILTKCNDVLYAAVADLVMAKTQDEFNKIQARCMEDIKAAGEAQAWEWCLAEFTKANETFKPIMGY